MLVHAVRIQWDMGHRLLNPESACAAPHGHHYVADVHLRSGEPIDALFVHARLQSWVMKYLHHGFVVCADDVELSEALSMIKAQRAVQVPFETSTENLARWLCAQWHKLEPSVCGVTLQQSEAVRATFALDPPPPQT